MSRSLAGDDSWSVLYPEGPRTAEEPMNRRTLAPLVMQHGSAVSTSLLDPETEIFRMPEIPGALGYRATWGCAVAIGDPVCAERFAAPLADAFREHCRARGWVTAYTVTSEAFATKMVERGYAAIEFGEELILDPQNDPQLGAAGRELRKKLNRATRHGVVAYEYDRRASFDAAHDAAMIGVADAWLRARRGPQVFLSSVRLFDEPQGKRWFGATHDGRHVGVLSTLELIGRGGPVFEHHLVTPDAPAGTSELLIAEALHRLREEGCEYATFGPAPAARLGRIVGLSRLSTSIARKVFDLASRRFHLDSRVRYRRKFQIARTEPAFLLFDPPSVGVRQLLGVLHAFHIGLK
jgi:lysylphosphatidylglycerol synthetase-like protein (DUF2156 family)